MCAKNRKSKLRFVAIPCENNGIMEEYTVGSYQ